VRLNKPRFATQVQSRYPLEDPQPINDLLTVTAWYLTEGHVNRRNGGVVISQANRDELERVGSAYQRITTGKGSIDFGAKSDSAWRLYLGSDIIRVMLEHYCGGSGASQKRIPDFAFQLTHEHQTHLLNELIKTDGSRAIQPEIAALSSDHYREHYFDYRTISPILAAQVGTLCSLLGFDYSVYTTKREGKVDAYRIRYCTGPGKRGGRNNRFTPFLHRRVTEGEWVYDIECIGNHNFVCGIGNVVCHNTNEAEYRRLLSNEYMEALRDRTIKIDIPYNTRYSEEVRIYERDFNGRRVIGKHIAPHTLEIAALWAVLTRLEDPKRAGLTLLQKLKLYDGRALPGFTEDSILELQAEAKNEGMFGISPRYIQDKLSNALVSDHSRTCLNPFMLMRELESGLKHHSLITSEDQRKRFRELLAVIRAEFDEIVKNEVQRAITADEEAIKRLSANYIDNVKAYTQRQRVRNPFTGQDEPPDERLMRSIEEKIDIPESRKDDFRREIMNYIGALAIDGKTFTWDANERLRRALELKLFEDQKDSIKLTSLVSNVIDHETQQKIDVVKSRMMKNQGYCDVCATDVLNYVASIFARGDVRER
jgi:serine protein kinase